MMAAKKFRGAGAMRSGSGPVAGAARRVVQPVAGAGGEGGSGSGNGKKDGEGGGGGRVGVAI